MKQHSLGILAFLAGSGAIAMLVLSSRTPDTTSTAASGIPTKAASLKLDLAARLEEARSKSPLVSYVRETSSPNITLESQHSEAQAPVSAKPASTTDSIASTPSRDRKQTVAREAQAQRDNTSEQNAIEITVPAGALLPTALIQTNEGVRPEAALNPAQQELADELATEFAEEIAQNEAKHPVTANIAESDAEALKAWKNAADRADERFRSLFGFEAYNRESARQHQLRNQPTN